MEIIIFIILGYLIGSIPSSVWLGKLIKGVDVRKYGSKNPGATNSLRVLGPKLGFLVLICDVSKGFLAGYVASLSSIDYIWVIVSALMAIIGHTFSIFLKFKGGKGVATTVGVFLFLTPKLIIFFVIVFLSVYFLTKLVSVASMTAVSSMPIFVYFTVDEYKYPLMIITAMTAILVIIRHSSNIKSLIMGNENKMDFKE